MPQPSVGTFGLSMVLLYAASGTYHAINLPQPSAVIEFFRRLDHSAIYAMIAGTYTPILSVVLAGTWARRLLPWVWRSPEHVSHAGKASRATAARTAKSASTAPASRSVRRRR